MSSVACLAAYHAALDAHDLVAVERMLSPDIHYISVGLGDIRGKAAVMQSLRDYFGMNPDHQAFDDYLEQHDDHTAISRWRLRATNKITGAVTERAGIEIVTFDATGLIAVIDVRDSIHQN
jgi:ketosteroid isomerase-like protein